MWLEDTAATVSTSDALIQEEIDQQVQALASFVAERTEARADDVGRMGGRSLGSECE
ncbi:hypothetical protein [Arthrobacter sp. MDT2-2]